MKIQIRSFFIVNFWGLVMMLGILCSGCVGLSVEKPLPPEGVQENYLIETPEIKYSRNSKVALLVTSYDFIKQQTQPFFLSTSDAPQNIFLDYHHSKEANEFDDAFGEKVQLFLKQECSLSTLDLKDNDKFSSFAKSSSLQLVDIIDWLRSNTNINLLLVFHYSLGEKGEARASMITPSITSFGNYTFYGASWRTKIKKFSAFTFQTCVFDIHKRTRVMAYNYPGFVNPSAAVDAFLICPSESEAPTKTFHDVLSKIFD
jgi:hypothetical protein